MLKYAAETSWNFENNFSMINLLKNTSSHHIIMDEKEMDYVGLSLNIMSEIYVVLKELKLPVKFKKMVHLETGDIGGYGLDFGGAFWTPLGSDTAEAFLILSGKDKRLEYYDFESVKLPKEKIHQLKLESYGSIYFRESVIDFQKLAFFSYAEESNSISNHMIIEQSESVFEQQKQFISECKLKNPKLNTSYTNLKDIPQVDINQIETSYAVTLEEMKKQLQKLNHPIYDYLHQEFKFSQNQIQAMFKKNQDSKDFIRNLNNSQFVKVSVQLNNEFEERRFLNFLSLEQFRNFTNKLLDEELLYKNQEGELFKTKYPSDIGLSFKKQPSYFFVSMYHNRKLYFDNFFGWEDPYNLKRVFLFESESIIKSSLQPQKVEIKAEKPPRF